MIGFLAAAALAAGQPRSILFVGNSFTFGAMSDVMTYRKDSVSDLNADADAMKSALLAGKNFTFRLCLPTANFFENAALPPTALSDATSFEPS